MKIFNDIYHPWHCRRMNKWKDRQLKKHPLDNLLQRWQDGQRTNAVTLDGVKAMWEYEGLHGPFWHKIAKKTIYPIHWWLDDHGPNATYRQIKWALQRVNKGWDNRSTWSLDTFLCSQLGGQLKHLAKYSHSYPGTEEYPTFESWADDLTKYGKDLETYGKDKFNHESFEETEITYNNAQAALKWVAENLGHLWD